MKRATLFAVAFAAAVVIGCDAKPPSETSAVAQATPSPTPSPTPSASPSPSPSPTPSPTPTATPSASPTASPSPTPAPTPTPWLSFTSKRYHYKISYPLGWVVTPGSAGYPDQFDDYGYPYVYIDRDTVAGTASVNLTIPHEVAYFKSHYKAKLVSTTKVRLAGGYVGKMLTYNGTDQGVKVVIREVLVAKGHHGYFLTMYGETAKAKADLATFKRMYGTWRPTA
jgi:hypothetical protein